MAEVLVNADELAEYFGARVGPRSAGIDVRRLNIEVGPAAGVWIDRTATLSYLEICNQAVGGSPILERIIGELREVTGG